MVLLADDSGLGVIAVIQQAVHADTQQPGQNLQILNIRQALVRFPFCNGGAGNAHFLRQLLLG